MHIKIAWFEKNIIMYLYWFASSFATVMAVTVYLALTVSQRLCPTMSKSILARLSPMVARVYRKLLDFQRPIRVIDTTRIEMAKLFPMSLVENVEIKIEGEEEEEELTVDMLGLQTFLDSFYLRYTPGESKTLIFDAMTSLREGWEDEFFDVSVPTMIRITFDKDLLEMLGGGPFIHEDCEISLKQPLLTLRMA